MRLDTLKDLVKIRDEKKKSFAASQLTEKKSKIPVTWEEYSNDIDENIMNLLHELINDEII